MVAMVSRFYVSKKQDEIRSRQDKLVHKCTDLYPLRKKLLFFDYLSKTVFLFSNKLLYWKIYSHARFISIVKTETKWGEKIPHSNSISNKEAWVIILNQSIWCLWVRVRRHITEHQSKSIWNQFPQGNAFVRDPLPLNQPPKVFLILSDAF